MAVNQEPFLSLAVDRPHGLTSNNTDAHYPGTHTSAHTLTTLCLLGAAPGLMCNWHDWLSPWQRECWPWQVPREQLVGSGRLVSKQIYSQSSTACPLNRGRNYKEAIRAKENKEGFVVQPSESTDWEEQKPFPSRAANSLEVLSVSSGLVARKRIIKKRLRLSEKMIQAGLLGLLHGFSTARSGVGRN